jgi:hypothetical protein
MKTGARILLLLLSLLKEKNFKPKSHRGLAGVQTSGQLDTPLTSLANSKKLNPRSTEEQKRFLKKLEAQKLKKIYPTR